jgi:hypothetical protein
LAGFGLVAVLDIGPPAFGWDSCGLPTDGRIDLYQLGIGLPSINAAVCQGGPK